MTRPLTLGAIAFAAVALAACGGDDGGTAKLDVPKANAPLSDLADRTQKAMTATDEDCPGLDQINREQDAYVRLNCASQGKNVQFELLDFKVRGGAEYGSGGVIDFTNNGSQKGAALVAVINREGHWSYQRSRRLNGPSIGTQPDRQAMESVLNDHFLPALRDGDCDEFFLSAATDASDRGTACKQELPAYSELSTELKESGNAKAVWLGGNKWFGFFGLQTDKPKKQYRTIVVQKNGPGERGQYVVEPTTLGPGSE